MSPNPNCPACHGHGQWYSPDNGQIVTCNCRNYSTLGATTHRTAVDRSELTSFEKPYFEKLERFVQLHQTVEIVYVVDGYLAKYMVTDGQICERQVKGKTIHEALQLLEKSLSESPPKRGGPKL